MIRVLLVDDQTLVRQGIRSLLELSDSVEVIAEAGNGEDALQELQSQSPDVMLLDIQMPKLDGIGVLRKMAELGIAVPVIVLTTFDDQQRLLECSRLGARGYLLKDVSLSQLVDAVATVHRGDTLIQPTLTVNIAEALQGQDDDSDGLRESMTKRELEVLRYLAGGYSNREIAEAVHLSEGTVKNHVSNILSKLDVRDRTRAVLKAIDLGLIGAS